MQDALEARVEALEIAYPLLAAKTLQIACFAAGWDYEDLVGFVIGHADDIRRRTGPEHISVIVDRLMEGLMRAPGDGGGSPPPGTAHRAATGEHGAKG